MTERVLAEVLVCQCNPTKNYASRATFNAHKKSQRHIKWELETSTHDLRTSLAEKEYEIARLNRKIMRLEKQVRVLAMAVAQERGFEFESDE